jgi:hypothetical protein
VFESLLKCDDVEDLESADTLLVELQESHINIGMYLPEISNPFGVFLGVTFYVYFAPRAYK